MTQAATIATAPAVWVPTRTSNEDLTPFDPASSAGWERKVASLPGCTFFHGSAWAQVLADSYGHRPNFLLCPAENGDPAGLLPIMEVSSPLTGRRGVALPFADFSPLLASDVPTAQRLLERAIALGQERRWRYLELRGLPHELSELNPSVSYVAHILDLRPGFETVLKKMDPAARRSLRKADQTGLEIEISRGQDAIQPYFRLHCATRKRHGLPPQPFHFFENLGRRVISPGNGFIAIARWLGQPVAGAVFVHAGRQVIYKYGASDEAFQTMRPNNLLFGKVIRHCAESGFETMHFGRTSPGNEGLRRFKCSLGAEEQPLHYARYHFRQQAWVSSTDRSSGPANAVFRMLPTRVLCGLGRFLYRHMS